MNDKDVTNLIEAQQTKPKRGRGGSNNFPNAKVAIQTEEDKALVSKLLMETMDAYRQEKVKSDEELKQRLNEYFEKCGRTGQIPTVEEMCLYTGFSQSTCWDWENGRNKGFSTETSQIIKKAKEYLKTFDAKLVISGKLNFLAYCFRAKNYYGMTDKQEYVLTPNTRTDSEYDAEDIRQRYLPDSPSDSDS